MDSELKKLIELENKVIELKAALETERMKAEILNDIIDKAHLKQGIEIKKIDIVPNEDSSPADDRKP